MLPVSWRYLGHSDTMGFQFDDSEETDGIKCVVSRLNECENYSEDIFTQIFGEIKWASCLLLIEKNVLEDLICRIWLNTKTLMMLSTWYSCLTEEQKKNESIGYCNCLW